MCLISRVDDMMVNNVGKEGSREKVITIRITDHEYDLVKQFCDNYDYTVSEYFRALMRIHLGADGLTKYQKYLIVNKLMGPNKE